MAIAIGGNQINKAYLGTTEIQKMYLGVDLVFDNNTVSLKPIMTNFRVEEATPTHIHFDTPLGPVTGLTDQGFTVSGRGILGVDDVNNFITLDSALDHWDNNTIRLESDTNSVYPFTMEPISNDINEPTSTLPKYVEVGANGTGTSGDPMSITAAFSEASANTIYWIKKGDYGDVQLTIGASGNVDAPTQFKGYDTVIGDLDGDYIVDSFTYTSPANAAAYLDPTKWPVINGTNSTSSRGIFASAKNYIIIKNIQVREQNYNIWFSSSCNGIIVENCTTALAYFGSGDGYGLLMGNTDTGQRVRVKKHLSFDNGVANIRLYGEHNAILSGGYYSGIDTNQSTDYYISLYKSHNTIVKGNYIQRDQTTHNGHSAGIKNGDPTSESTYNLFVENESVRVIGENYYAAHEGTHHNVFKRNKGTGNFISPRNGAHDNIFEQNYGEDCNFGVYIWGNLEAYPYPGGSVAKDNIIRDNIFNGGVRGLASSCEADQNYSLDNNHFYGNTWYDFNTMFYNLVGTYSLTFIGNTFTNNNVISIPDIYAAQSQDSDFAKTYCNFFDSESTPSGTGNIAINPDFVDLVDFVPRADLGQIGAPKLSNYDHKQDERGAITAIGGSVGLNESGGGVPFGIISYEIYNETETTVVVRTYITEQCSINYYVDTVKNAASSDDFNAGELGSHEFRHTRTLTGIDLTVQRTLVIEVTAEDDGEIVQSGNIDLPVV